MPGENQHFANPVWQREKVAGSLEKLLVTDDLTLAITVKGNSIYSWGGGGEMV